MRVLFHDVQLTTLLIVGVANITVARAIAGRYVTTVHVTPTIDDRLQDQVQGE
jgi:hypothetical protein